MRPSAPTSTFVVVPEPRVGAPLGGTLTLALRRAIPGRERCRDARIGWPSSRPEPPTTGKRSPGPRPGSFHVDRWPHRAGDGRHRARPMECERGRSGHLRCCVDRTRPLPFASAAPRGRRVLVTRGSTALTSACSARIENRRLRERTSRAGLSNGWARATSTWTYLSVIRRCACHEHPFCMPS